MSTHSSHFFPFVPSRLRTASILFQTAILAAVVALALSHPVQAAEKREVVLRIKPNLPEMAKRMRIGGTVVLQVTIKPDGTVKAAKPVTGNSMLSEAAKEAVLKWKFAQAEAESVEVVEVGFTL